MLTNLQFYTGIKITAKKNTESFGNFKCFSRLGVLLKVDKKKVTNYIGKNMRRIYGELYNFFLVF